MKDGQTIIALMQRAEDEHEKELRAKWQQACELQIIETCRFILGDSANIEHVAKAVKRVEYVE